MEKFTVPTRDQVSPANQANFDALKKAIGMVPNLYAAIAYSDNGLSRYLAFQGAKTSLTNKEKEAVNLVVSEVNGCIYCQSAHTLLGKMNGFTDDETLKIRAGHATDPKLNALVTFAKDITLNKGRVSPSSLEAFFAAGYDKAHLVDTILQISDYASLLHVTPKVLAKVAKTHFKKTVSALISERIIIEAKRELYMSSKTIKEIAYLLGFDDEFYFSRFFKNNADVSPQLFRETVGFARAENPSSSSLNQPNTSILDQIAPPGAN